MKKKVLLIEDETGIADSLNYVLDTEGFDFLWATTGTRGLELLREHSPDLVILDIGLPDMNGFEIIKEIRTFSQIPVLFLTARAEEIDRVLGLELGGDDYVTKPFSPREVAARIKAILRRTGSGEEPSPSAPLTIDTGRRQIQYHTTVLSLSRYEYEILALFMSRPGWVFSREKIMELLWNEPEESFERTVDAHIKSLRAKLRAVDPEQEVIITHRGVGYSLSSDNVS